MIQITPHMRILVAVEPTDFRRGMDGLARVCKDAADTIEALKPRVFYDM